MLPTKETALGAIPADWQVCPLGDVLDVAQYGLSVRGAETGKYPILRMNCQVDGEVVLRDLQYVDLDERTFAAFSLRRGDLLFNRTNSYELVGRCAIYENEAPAVFASYLLRLGLDRKRADPAYLNFLLNWSAAQGELKKLASRGVSQANISASKLRTFLVHLPGLSEQASIAMALEQIRVQLRSEAGSLSSLSELKRAAMREMFTRGVRGEAQKETDIGLAPQSWQRLPISSLGKVVTGNTPPTKNASNYAGGDIPFVSPGDIEHGAPINDVAKRITASGLATARPLREGAVCFVSIGSTIGKVGITTMPICATNQQINSIVPRPECDPWYVFHLLTYWSDHVRREVSPGPVPILSKGAFERIEILVTTDSAEQREIAALLNSIDRKIALHKRKKAMLEALFKALLHKLMTGEIRVSDLDLSALTPAPAATAA